VIYVYTQQSSHSARLLATTLHAVRIKRHRPLKATDVVVNWGSRDIAWATDQKALVLNPLLEMSKKAEIFSLQAAKLPTPPLSLQWEGEGWYGRSLHHSHGRDFLTPNQTPGRAPFYVQRLPIKEEYRLHAFNFDGKEDVRILRWGKKVPRDERAHEWVRSDDAGWRLSYGLPSKALPRGLRPLAKSALLTLQYDWGAVDMGLTSEGKPIIFEVNSAPGLDEGGKTIQLYAQAIQERLKKENHG